MELLLAALIGALVAAALCYGLLRRPVATPAAPDPRSELAGIFERYEAALQRLEVHQAEELAGIKTQLSGLGETGSRLRDETARLVGALSNSQLRGHWGEVQLRRAVELAGMLPNVDFVEQSPLDGGRLRPDMIVRLPGQGSVVVDSKAPLGSFLRPETGPDHARVLAGDFRRHINALSGKEYQKALPHSVEFVVMFVPNEAILAAAVTADAELMEYGWQRRVVIASPATLVAILFAVAQGWRQETASKNVARIAELGLEIYQRLQVMTVQFDNVQSALDEAGTALKAARWHLQSRVFVSGRKLQELTGADKALVEREG